MYASYILLVLLAVSTQRTAATVSSEAQGRIASINMANRIAQSNGYPAKIAGQLSYPTAAVEEQPAIAIAPPPAPIVEPVVEAAPVVAPAQYAPTPVVASAPIVAPPPVVAPAPAFPYAVVRTYNHFSSCSISMGKTGHTSDTAVIYEGGHFPFGHLPANRIFGDMHVDGPFRARKKLATKKAVLARINLEKKS
ncbi:hypothetical protein RB195_005807 [Necator americanus]|uniref:Uncharacterized protein n=1 Tax=Necator americanus TaxID=51031 RepID=A0ABR1BTH5_NECAM